MYHFGDGTINGTGKNRISAQEYRKKHQKDIDEINEYFNKYDILDKAIERFVIKCNNSKYYIDAIIHGEVDDFFWLTTNEIKNIIMSKKNSYSSAIHFW